MSEPFELICRVLSCARAAMPPSANIADVNTASKKRFISFFSPSGHQARREKYRPSKSKTEGDYSYGLWPSAAPGLKPPRLKLADLPPTNVDRRWRRYAGR